MYSISVLVHSDLEQKNSCDTTVFVYVYLSVLFA